MTWGVDQVDQERLGVAWVSNISLVVKGYTSRLDGDATLLLVSTSIGKAGITSRFAGNDTGFSNEGVREGGLSVVDVGNDRHVTDLVCVVHDLSDLLDSEVGHFVRGCF